LRVVSQLKATYYDYELFSIQKGIDVTEKETAVPPIRGTVSYVYPYLNPTHARLRSGWTFATGAAL
jgi:hypothetical protein